ncbi:MAG: phosphatase PAP2 family protein [Pirellulaceae bacterium]
MNTLCNVSSRLFAIWLSVLFAICGNTTVRAQDIVDGQFEPPNDLPLFLREPATLENAPSSPGQQDLIVPEWEGNRDLEFATDTNAIPPASIWDLLWQDQVEFYSRDTLRIMTPAMVFGAVSANTKMDQEFADWYQDNVRSSGSNDFAKIVKTFGEQWQMAAVYLSASVVGRTFDIDPRVQLWGDRSFRATLVGVPALWLGQRALGGSRPRDIPPSSNWDFWADENGVSGHAFVGAVPFLTAAQLSERPVAKFGWTFASTWTAWSRINDNDHYLSQVVIGWCLAYAATEAVRRSDQVHGIEIRPWSADGASGLQLGWRY